MHMKNIIRANASLLAITITAASLVLGGCRAVSSSPTVAAPMPTTVAVPEPEQPSPEPSAEPAPSAEPTPNPTPRPTPQIVEIMSEPMVDTKFLMGTICAVKLYHNASEETMIKAFERIAEIELALSANISGTEVDMVNLKAGIEPVKVGRDMFNVVKRGLEYSEKSGGGFDITIGAISNLWRIGFDDARIPSQEEIDAALPLVDYKNVEIDEASQTVFLKRTGMRLDLGAIVKGYAADEVARVLRENGVASAIIDLGGNIYVVGQKGDKPWSVGVQDPVQSRGQVLGIVPLSDKSVVTSGIYERYLKDTKGEPILASNGKRYHHLLDPFTGYPFDNELVSVTIFSDYSIDGDGLSTVLFAKGLSDGMEFIETIPDVEAAFVTYDDKVYISSGLQGEFSLYTELYTMGN